jgi:hypothetical protein
MAATPTVVSLADNLVDVDFFSDAACTAPVSAVAIPAWTSEVPVYLRPNAAGTAVIAASAAGYADDTQQLLIYPNVRRGSCQLDLGITKVTCPIDQPVFSTSKAFSMIQAVSRENAPTGGQARCTLSSPSTIDCARDGGTGTVDINWQVAELASGIAVQRATMSCASGTLVTLPQAFAPAQSFVLYTNEHGGNAFDENDHKVVRLVGTNQVESLADTDCGGPGVNDIQVVELQDAVVNRGLTGSFTQTSATVSSLPTVDLTRTFLLGSARFTLQTGLLCGYHVRGQLSGQTSLAFTRGDGVNGNTCSDPGVQDLGWERVQLPAGYSVQQVVMAITDGGSFASATIAAVDPARSLIFASGAFTNGQGYGETSYNADDVPGAAGARFSFGAADRIDLVRGFDGGTARWTVYAVQLP